MRRWEASKRWLHPYVTAPARWVAAVWPAKRHSGAQQEAVQAMGAPNDSREGLSLGSQDSQDDGCAEEAALDAHCTPENAAVYQHIGEGRCSMSEHAQPSEESHFLAQMSEAEKAPSTNGQWEGTAAVLTGQEDERGAAEQTRALGHVKL